MSNDYEKKRSALTVSTASIDAYSDELKRIENKIDVQPMKGWMKKKSPAILKGWQKRYFMLVENLQEGPWKLVYFDNDVKNRHQAQWSFRFTLGFRFIQYSTIRHPIISKKEFTIQFPGRNLELKVKTPELSQQWITTLNSLRTAPSPQRTNRQVSMDSVVKMADESPTKIQNHKIVDTYTAQQAQMYKERQRNSLLVDLSKGDTGSKRDTELQEEQGKANHLPIIQ